MLKNTFVHVQGVGTKTEQKIWEAGIHNWQQFLENGQTVLSLGRKVLIQRALEDSATHITNPRYFARTLQSHDHWRLFQEFRDTVAYLDIESTGLDFDRNEITTIALYDGQSVKTYVNGRNLNDFAHDIRQYQVLVTFNGKTFDVPFIERYFNITLDQAHIDLRYVLTSLGLRGGLKRIETRLNMDRGGLKDVDGYFAVLLWQAYQTARDPRVLETLLAYNVQDTINLEHLMVTAYNRKLRGTPFHAQYQLPLPPTCANPFNAHAEVIQSIRRAIF